MNASKIIIHKKNPFFPVWSDVQIQNILTYLLEGFEKFQECLKHQTQTKFWANVEFPKEEGGGGRL